MRWPGQRTPYGLPFSRRSASCPVEGEATNVPLLELSLTYAMMSPVPGLAFSQTSAAPAA